MNKPKIEPMVVDEELSESRASWGPIRLAVFQSTAFCNIDCRYCYLPNRAESGQMPIDIVEASAERIFESPLVRESITICWHAGEPLTLPTSYYRTAIDKIESARLRLNPSVKITYSIQTNAMLISTEWLNMIQDRRIRMGVSIDGPELVHDAYRVGRNGAGTLDKTLDGIKRLQERGIPFTAITVLTDKSLDHAHEIYNFFDLNGIHRVGFNVEEIEGVNRATTLDHSSTHHRLRAFFQTFWERVAASNGQFWVREFERVGEFVLRKKPTIKNQLTTPFCIVSIDKKGDFSTFSPELLAMDSSEYGNFVFGNVKKDTLLDVSNTQKFKDIYTKIKAGVEKCRSTCQYFSLCGGGAPSNKYWENGTFACSETLACVYGKKLPYATAINNLERGFFNPQIIPKMEGAVN